MKPLYIYFKTLLSLLKCSFFFWKRYQLHQKTVSGKVRLCNCKRTALSKRPFPPESRSDCRRLLLRERWGVNINFISQKTNQSIDPKGAASKYRMKNLLLIEIRTHKYPYTCTYICIWLIHVYTYICNHISNLPGSLSSSCLPHEEAGKFESQPGPGEGTAFDLSSLTRD